MSAYESLFGEPASTSSTQIMEPVFRLTLPKAHPGLILMNDLEITAMALAVVSPYHKMLQFQ